MLPFASRHPVFLGVVHLLATPGSPGFAGSFERVLERALEDARTLVDNGVDGLIVENFGDAPFFPERVPPECIASLAICTRAVRLSANGRPVGVNVLRNDARSALGICAVTGASFVRVNVHSGAAVTDQGLIQGRAFETLRARAALAPQVAILADAHVKHASPLGRESLADAVADLVLRGLADAVIVSGPATGRAPLASAVQEARGAAARAPLFIGSGLDAHNAAELLAQADGAIVGTALKLDGRVENAVDAQRVARLRGIFDRLERAR